MKAGNRFSDAFKKDAVAQVVDRGYAVKEVAARPGISTKSLYTWKAEFSKPDKVRRDDGALSAELRRAALRAIVKGVGAAALVMRVPETWLEADDAAPPYLT